MIGRWVAICFIWSAVAAVGVFASAIAAVVLGLFALDATSSLARIDNDDNKQNH